MAGDLRSDDVAAPALDGTDVRLAIVVARFNSAITTRLLDGALARSRELGVADVEVGWVPGAFELPIAAATWATSGAVDAVVAIGCVIRGETSHYELVAGECARGLMCAGLDAGRPVIFSVLTTEDEAQALARSEPGGGHNVGREGVEAAVEMVALLRRITG